MTYNELVTNNSLIAEFMGYKYFMGYGYHGDVYYDEAVIDPADADFVQSPHWHDEWNWLMPVVEKITQIPTGDDDFFYPRTFGLRDADGNFLFRFNMCALITAKTLIEAAHGAVVEFIKWHNENKKA